MREATSLGVTAERAGSPTELSARADDLARRYARLIRFAVERVAGANAARIGEDVEQQVLIQILRQLADEQIIRHPTSYIYRTAIRETVRMLRGEAAVRLRHAAAAAELPPPEPRDPERVVVGRELRGQVEQALQTMGDDRRRATRAHLAGFSVKEIMSLYGWSYGRARNLIARGMADLRRALREMGVDG